MRYQLRTALVFLALVLWALPADALNPFRQNRDNARLTAKLGAKAEGWTWLQTTALDNYCHRVIDRLEDRAMRRLRERDRYDWFFDREDEIIDWDPKRRLFRRGGGEPPVGANPCLLPGVESGLQPKISKFQGLTGESFTVATDCPTCPDLDCEGCWRGHGAICAAARNTQRKISAVANSIADSHGDEKLRHGINKAVDANSATLAECRRIER